ncbi:MAG: AAA family ATPase [Metamycoplasmataceae bacterium]
MDYSINPELKIFENMKKNKKLFHAFLFYGNKKTDIFTPAFQAIKILISDKKDQYKNAIKLEDLNYPDLTLIKPENNFISKSEIILVTLNKLQETSLVKDKLKILFIQDVDLASLHSLNALLKFIEEPTKNTIIIMTTNRISKVISTIKSRTQNIYIKPKPNQYLIDSLKQEKQFEGYEEILISIYGNNRQKIEDNFEPLKKDFNDLIKSLEEIKINKESLRTMLHLKLNKKNYENIVNILEILFLELTKKEIVVFTNHQKLINSFSLLNFNFETILVAGNDLKSAINNYGNFALQKEKYLIALESSFDV